MSDDNDARTEAETRAEEIVRRLRRGAYVMPRTDNNGWIVILPANGWPKPGATRAEAWDNAVAVLDPELAELRKWQSWNECEDTFRECPRGGYCFDLSGRERDICLGLGYCRGVKS